MIPQERLASPQERLADTVRDEGRRVLATLIRTLGDLQLAEDAVQEAAVAALRAWPAAGVPDDPRAWLTVTARNKAYDMLRHEAARPVKETAAAWPAPQESADPAQEVLDMVEPESVVHDDLLRLVFTCCHPALAREAQVALALRTLAGLEIAAIARAFLVPEATMAKRLVRARQKIAHAGIPYRVPADTELPQRLPAVLAVVHLIATEAHAPSAGDDVVRVDLEVEALRLGQLIAGLMPGEPEVISLLALLLFTAAGGRPAAARTGSRCCWPTRIAPAGITPRSPRHPRCWRTRSADPAAPPGRTSCRRTWLPATRWHRAGPTLTGTASSGSTTWSWPDRQTRPSRSTGPWRWRSGMARLPGLPHWTASAGCLARICGMRPGRTHWSASAGPATPGRNS